MELRYKPQFKKDYLKIKNSKVKVLLAAHLRQIMQANTISETGQFSKLEKY